MVSVIDNTKMTELLKIFSDKLWDCIKDKSEEQKKLYDDKVLTLIDSLIKTDTDSRDDTKKQKPKIPIPFCGFI